MKKVLIILVLIILSVSGCKNLAKNEDLKINLVGDFTPDDKVTVLLFTYDERIAGKKADLIGKEEIVLKKQNNTVTFTVPEKDEKNVYYISLENSKDYNIDYSSGSVQKLETAKDNEIKIIRKKSSI